MTDLLTKLGSKKGEGMSPAPTASSEVVTPVGSGAPTDNLSRGHDLLAGGAVKESSATSKASKETEKTAETVTEDNSTVKDPDSWTKESALQEVKSARAEAKNTRIKYQEQVQVLKSEMESKIESIKNEYKEALEAKKELEALKAHEADKKRDLSEKLAHREAMIAQLQAEKDQLAKDRDQKLATMNEQLKQLEAERKAQLEVYSTRVGEELGKIPEQFKEFAQSMVKGCEDPREALHILSEAKLKGLFEEKKIMVNHSVPNAQTGARATKEKMEAAAEEVRKNMTPTDKIRAGLSEIRKGTPNSMYRGR